MIRIGTAALAIPALPAEDDWRTRGICKPEDDDLFFPASTTGANAALVQLAKGICQRCPVVTECRQWALDVREEFGVWGGLDETERRAILRQAGEIKQRGPGRQPAECGTRAAYDRHKKYGEPIDNLCATEGRYAKPLAGASLPPAEVAA